MVANHGSYMQFAEIYIQTETFNLNVIKYTFPIHLYSVESHMLEVIAIKKKKKKKKMLQMSVYMAIRYCHCHVYYHFRAYVNGLWL